MFRIDTTDKSELGISSTEILDYGNHYYMKPYKDKIRDLDIRNFNYIVFDEDINNMIYDEFKNYYTTDFSKIIELMNEYIFIDTDLIKNMEDNSTDLTKIKTYVKNVTKFYMMTLPYIHLKDIIPSDIKGFHDVLDFINDCNVIELIIKSIDKNIEEQNNFYKLMKNVQDEIVNNKKKDKMDDMTKVLEININEKIKVFEYYKSLIKLSSNEKLKDLLKQYIKNDIKNIL